MKKSKNESIIQVVEKNNKKRVFIAGKEVFNGDEYYIYNISESDMDKFKGSDIPDDLLLAIDDENDFSRINISKNVTLKISVYNQKFPKVKVELFIKDNHRKEYQETKALLNIMIKNMLNSDILYLMTIITNWDKEDHITFSFPISYYEKVSISVKETATKIEGIVKQSQKEYNSTYSKDNQSKGE